MLINDILVHVLKWFVPLAWLHPWWPLQKQEPRIRVPFWGCHCEYASWLLVAVDIWLIAGGSVVQMICFCGACIKSLEHSHLYQITIPKSQSIGRLSHKTPSGFGSQFTSQLSGGIPSLKKMKFPIGAQPIFRGVCLLVSGRVGGFLFTRKTWLKLLEFIFGGWIPLPKCSISAGGGSLTLKWRVKWRVKLKAERNPDCSVKHETKGMAQNQQPPEYNYNKGLESYNTTKNLSPLNM